MALSQNDLDIMKNKGEIVEAEIKKILVKNDCNDNEVMAILFDVLIYSCSVIFEAEKSTTCKKISDMVLGMSEMFSKLECDEVKH